MKKNIILSGVAALLLSCAMDASAQFNYQNGDMIAAFGNGGSADVIVDLGSLSQFQVGGSGGAWNLSSLLSTNLGGVSSSLYWAVFGVNDTALGSSDLSGQTDRNTIWATLARFNTNTQSATPHIGGSSSSYGATRIMIQTIANNTSPSQAGSGLIQDLAPGQELVDTSLGYFSPMMKDPYSGNFQGTWYYNALNNGAGISDLYLNNPVVSPSTYLGNFVLSDSGLLTFNPVPEPSTWAMLGGGVLALLALRHRSR